MIRPWYRSRLFWLGLPGLVFLLWLWLAKARTDLSLGHTRMIQITEATTHYIGTCDGSIYLFTRKYRVGISGTAEYGFHSSSEEFEPDEPVVYFPARPFGMVHGNDKFQEHRELWVAWWAVISAYLMTWLGALVLWQRRKTRLSRRAAAAGA